MTLISTTIFHLNSCKHWIIISIVCNYPPKGGEQWWMRYTAISRKVIRKSACDNPEKYCGWFWVLCSSKKFERTEREAMDVCLRMLKESSNRRFNSYSVRNSVLIISHITFRDCRVHIFSDDLFRNSCISSAVHRPWAEGDSCFSIYQISWIKLKKSNFW